MYARHTTVLLLLTVSCASGAPLVLAPETSVRISVGTEPVDAIRAGRYSNHYQARVPLEICNRGPAALRLWWINISPEGRETGINLTFDSQPLAPGDCLRKAVTLGAREPGAYDIHARLSDAEGGESWTVQRRFQVVNPERTRALAECEACDGDWGAHGILGIEGCICRSKDKGTICYDGKDCDGICLYKRFELVHEAEPVRCDENGRCATSLAPGRPVGECSEFLKMFGCFSYIPDGTADETPFAGAWAVPRICVD